MALPQSAVEQLSRRPLRSPGWFSQLLMFSGTLFFLSVGIYIGLVYGYGPYVARQVKTLEGQIQRFAQQVPAQDQEQIITFASQLANIQTLLNKHVAISPLLAWLEKNTVPNVYFSKMAFTDGTNQISLSGVGRTLDDVTAQLKIFQLSDQVERVNFSNTTVGSKNTWQFDLTLVVKPTLLSTKAAAAAAVPQEKPVAAAVPAPEASRVVPQIPSPKNQ